MSGLWKNHPAAPHQQSLFSKATRKRKAQPTQADMLIAMLRASRANRRSLDLPAIMQAGIAQHCARFNGIRSQGFTVRNQTDRQRGAARSRYWLDYDPEQDGPR